MPPKESRFLAGILARDRGCTITAWTRSLNAPDRWGKQYFTHKGTCVNYKGEEIGYISVCQGIHQFWTTHKPTTQVNS